MLIDCFYRQIIFIFQSYSGGDATVVFNDIGHSSFARTLLKKFLYWSPPETVRAIPRKQSLNVSSNDSQYSRLSLSASIVSETAQHVTTFTDSLTSLLSMSSGYSQQQQSSTLPSAAVPPSSSHSIRLEGRASYRSRPLGWSRYQDFMTKKQKLLQKFISDSNNQAYMSSVESRVTVAALHRTPCCCPTANNLLNDSDTENATDYNSMRIGSSFISNFSSSLSGRIQITTAVHSGQCRVCYDPVEGQWYGWWSCCGYAHICFAE